MEKKIIVLLRPIAFILSLFFSLKLQHFYRLFLNLIYSYSVKRSFIRTGSNFFIQCPAVIHGPNNISIGNNFYSFARLRLEAFNKHLSSSFNPKIEIGDNVSINYDCHIGCINRVVIGNNVLIASKVFITDHLHGNTDTVNSLNIPPSLRLLQSSGPVVIENNVWVGEGVAILPNVRIGQNSIIGANAVVTKNIPPNCIVAGVPAKVIREVI